MRTSKIQTDARFGTVGEAMSLGEYSKGKKINTPHQIQFGGVSMVVGKYADEHASTNQTTLDLTRFTRSGEAERALFYTTLGKLLEPGKHDVVVRAGLPIEVHKKDNANLDWMRGSHEFVLDGHEYGVHVNAVKTMSQPGGSFFNWGMNENGWAREEYNPRDNGMAWVGVVDVGYKTADTIVDQNGRPIPSKTRGSNIGATQIAKAVARIIENKYGSKFSHKYLDEYYRSGDTVIRTQSGEIDVANLFDRVKPGVASKIVEFVQEEADWGNGRQFYQIIFTGGGARALESELAKVFPMAKFYGDIANVKGFALFENVQSDGIIIGYDPGYGFTKGAILND